MILLIHNHGQSMMMWICAGRSDSIVHKIFGFCVGMRSLARLEKFTSDVADGDSYGAPRLIAS